MVGAPVRLKCLAGCEVHKVDVWDGKEQPSDVMTTVDDTARVMWKSCLYKAAVGGQETGISNSPEPDIICW